MQKHVAISTDTTNDCENNQAHYSANQQHVSSGYLALTRGKTDQMSAEYPSENRYCQPGHQRILNDHGVPAIIGKGKGAQMEELPGGVQNQAVTISPSTIQPMATDSNAQVGKRRRGTMQIIERPMANNTLKGPAAGTERNKGWIEKCDDRATHQHVFVNLPGVDTLYHFTLYT